MSCLYHFFLGTLSHHSLLLFLIFIISSNRSVTTSPTLLLFLPPSERLFVIQSAFNTCQPSWGTSYTVRISFVRAPQDFIRGSSLGLMADVALLFHHKDSPQTKQPSHHRNPFSLLGLSDDLIICN